MAKILIAEDDPSIGFTLKADLMSEGYDVTLATTGADTLRLGLERPYDLILLDVMLPGPDGFEICRTLRRSRVSAPILMLTAKAQEAEKVMGLDLGADDYITKPYSPRELRARVKSALRRAGGEKVDIFRFGEVEVDFKRGEVRRGGQRVDLSALEFRLLTTFVKEHGRVMTRGQLLDAVWGPGFAVNDRVVDNHIVSLRRQIEPDPTEPKYLVNVRGLGYRFDA